MTPCTCSIQCCRANHAGWTPPKSAEQTAPRPTLQFRRSLSHAHQSSRSAISPCLEISRGGSPRFVTWDLAQLGPARGDVRRRNCGPCVLEFRWFSQGCPLSPRSCFPRFRIVSESSILFFLTIGAITCPFSAHRGTVPLGPLLSSPFHTSPCGGSEARHVLSTIPGFLLPLLDGYAQCFPLSAFGTSSLRVFMIFFTTRLIDRANCPASCGLQCRRSFGVFQRLVFVLETTASSHSSSCSARARRPIAIPAQPFPSLTHADGQFFCQPVVVFVRLVSNEPLSRPLR